MINLHQEFRKISLFNFLSQSDIKQITEFSKIVNYKKDNFLFFQDEEAENLFILIAGSIKLYKTDPKGDEVVIHNFTQITSIAEMPFFEKTVYPATAICNEDSKVALINGKKFREFSYKNPEILYHFITSLSKKVKMLEQKIKISIVYTGKQKVAKFIYENWNNFQNMKKKEVAEILHITPEHLSRILRELKNLGLIDQKNKPIIEKRLEIFKIYS